MEHPLSLEQLPDGVQRVVAPTAPGPARMMAARGVAPLPPGELVTAMYALSYDSDEKLRLAAIASLAKLPDRVLLPALEGDVSAHVLDHVSRSLPDHQAALEKIILNPGTDPDTVFALAKRCSEKLAELIAVNEARLLAAPRIIEALYLNRNTRMSTATRAVELAIRNGIALTGLEAFREIAAAIGQELIPEPSPEPLPTDLDYRQTEAAGSEEVDVVLVAPEEAPEVEPQPREEFLPLHRQLAQLSVTEKIRMAITGSAAHRMLLVRDPNRLVHMSAARSPALTQREVEAMLRDRALPEEVIRHIASKREWLRHYQVKVGLVFHPKTPAGTALQFLVHLRNTELRNVARSKAIPSAIVQGAKELLRKKAGGT